MCTIKLFCATALCAEPTCAHYALALLVREKQSALLTENIDLLQHKTGYAPLSPHSVEFDNLTAQDIKAVDMIICIGLSHDDCGFLAHYKHYNPKGILVALDLKQPNYLSSTDFWLQGDIQELMPALAEKSIREA